MPLAWPLMILTSIMLNITQNWTAQVIDLWRMQIYLGLIIQDPSSNNDMSYWQPILMWGMLLHCTCFHYHPSMEPKVLWVLFPMAIGDSNKLVCYYLVCCLEQILIIEAKRLLRHPVGEWHNIIGNGILCPVLRASRASRLLRVRRSSVWRQTVRSFTSNYR